MNESIRREIQKRTLVSLQGIIDALLAPDASQDGHINTQWLEFLPITKSRLPFKLDEEIDFGPHYLTPYPREKFQSIFSECFGADRDTEIQCEKLLVKPGEQTSWPTIAFGRVIWTVYDYEASMCRGQNTTIAEEFVRDFDHLLKTVALQVCDQDGCLKYDVRFIDHSNWCQTWVEFQDNRYIYKQCYGDNDRPKCWRIFGMRDLGKDDRQPRHPCTPKAPHLSCSIIQDTPFNDEVLRSEVLSIAMLMSDLIKQREWDDHRLFPIYCYVFNGPQVRITQGVFDGNSLQLRQTDPIDIGRGRESRENVKMLLRWVMGEPACNTKWETSDVEVKEQAARGTTAPIEIEASA